MNSTRLMSCATAALMAGLLAAPALALEDKPDANETVQRDRGAQKAAEKTAKTDKHDKAASSDAIRASKWIGKDLHDSTGEKVGEISDIALAGNSGRVLYVVVRDEGTLSIGDMRYAAPLSAIEHHADKGAMRVSITKKQMKTAAELEKGKWPTAGDTQWRQKMDRGYGVERDDDWVDIKTDEDNLVDRSRKAINARVIPVSKLMNAGVQQPNGKRYGTIHDVLIDRESERASFVLLEPKEANESGDLAAVPYSVFNVTLGDDHEFETAMLAVERRKVDANMVRKGEVDKLANREHAAKVYQSYEATPYWETYGTERTREDAREKPNADGDRRQQQQDAPRKRGGTDTDRQPDGDR